MAEKLCKEIQDGITLITADLKLALDCLFDVIEETNLYKIKPELDYDDRFILRQKVQKARDLYRKHFVC